MNNNNNLINNNNNLTGIINIIKNYLNSQKCKKEVYKNDISFWDAKSALHNGKDNLNNIKK